MVRRQSLGLSKNVLERRDLCTFWMRAALRLLELLRVAEKHDVLRRPRRAENERSPSYVARQHGKIERAIAEMARALGDRTYLCGEAITLADLAAGVALSYVDYRLPTVEWRGKYPALARFADALEQRPSFRRSNNDPSREAPDPA